MSISKLLRLLGGAALVCALMVVTPQGSVAGGGCHSAGNSSDSVASEMAIVELQQCAFQPAVVRVAAGTEVVFVNRDTVPHAVTGSGWGNADSLELGESVSYSFDRPGVFAYQCYIHPGMVGAIVVAESNDAPPPSEDSPAEPPSGTSVETSTPVLVAIAGLPAALTFVTGLSIGWLRGRRSAG